MKYEFHNATEEDTKFIQDLIDEVNLNENFDYEAKISILEYKGEKAGLYGYSFQKTDKGQLPIFEHILVRLKFQKSRIGIFMMMNVEKNFKEQGYNQYLSYILKNNDRMKNYAEKWGMKSYQEDEEGNWYYKNI